MIKKLQIDYRKIAIIFSAISAILILFTALFEPFSYPIGYMMIGRGRFADFYDTFRVAAKYPNLGSYCIAPWQYYLFNFANKGFNPNYLFATYNAIIIILITKIIYSFKEDQKRTTLLWIIFTYPLFFGLWRGNPEVIAILFLFLSVIELEHNKNKSFILYLIAVFIKPNTLFYGIIFLMSLNLKRVFTGILFLLLILFLTISFDNFSAISSVSGDCLKAYKTDYIDGEGGTFLNNSLYGLIKYLLYSNLNYSLSLEMAKSFYDNFTKYWIFEYIGICSIGFLLLNRLSSLYIVFASFILLYPVSADYRLVSLLIPLGLIVTSDNAKFKYLAIIIFIIILPKHLINSHFTDLKILITINSLVNPILLILSIVYCFFIDRKKLNDKIF